MDGRGWRRGENESRTTNVFMAPLSHSLTAAIVRVTPPTNSSRTWHSSSRSTPQSFSPPSLSSPLPRSYSLCISLDLPTRHKVIRRCNLYLPASTLVDKSRESGGKRRRCRLYKSPANGPQRLTHPSFSSSVARACRMDARSQEESSQRFTGSISLKFE